MLIGGGYDSPYQLWFIFIKTFNFFCVCKSFFFWKKIVSTVRTQNIVNVCAKTYSNVSFYFCRHNFYFAVVKKIYDSNFFPPIFLAKSEGCIYDWPHDCSDQGGEEIIWCLAIEVLYLSFTLYLHSFWNCFVYFSGWQKVYRLTIVTVSGP